MADVQVSRVVTSWPLYCDRRLQVRLLAWPRKLLITREHVLTLIGEPLADCTAGETPRWGSETPGPSLITDIRGLKLRLQKRVRTLAARRRTHMYIGLRPLKWFGRNYKVWCGPV